VLGVLAVALGLRLWGTNFGLPYDLTYDEGKEVHRALKLGAGEYLWEFGKGGLYYLLFVEYAVLYVVWWTLGVVHNTHEFALRIIQDLTAVYLLGRLTVALMGTLTCLVVFAIGRRVYDWRVGLGAAVIGATAYYHGEHSHTINVDIGATLALWASIWAYLEYENRQKLRWLVSTGAFGGIAIAFKEPGAIVVLPLLLAIASRPDRPQDSRSRLKEAGIVLLALLITLTVVAPEWTASIGTMPMSFSRLLGTGVTATGPAEGDVDDAMRRLMASEQDWTGYFTIILKDYNVVLTLCALLGASLGLWRRHRWDIIWIVFSVVFLGILTAADRGAAERYMLPIVPALWLLGSGAIAAVAGQRRWVTAAGLACVVIPPLLALVRYDYELTKPDTRILAKEWIEAHVPSGAKILMDGLRYRFMVSPPLIPNETVITRQVTQAAQEGSQLSRGVSQRALALYAEAMAQMQGPKYELHSTVWGLKVDDLTYYVQTCFDYIITSSENAERYTHGRGRQRFPKSAQFYEQLPTDPRFRVLYSVAPVSWQSRGPTITVYKVLPPCEASQNGTKRFSQQ
jgi:hypothetical protein